MNSSKTFFLSSPGDALEEREKLQQAISENSPLWQDALGVSLNAITGNTYVLPGVSDYPQKVVNEATIGKYVQRWYSPDSRPRLITRVGSLLSCPASCLILLAIPSLKAWSGALPFMPRRWWGGLVS
jgi:hypothetical protein